MPNPSPDEWQALSPRLDEALGMTDDEHSTWFRTLEDREPSRELSEEGFLAERPVELPGTPGLAGQTLGVYTLVSQIGQEGMGTVWLAERSDGRFERRVAVQLLNIAFLGKGGEERFKREGRIPDLLRHPNIAELIDAGVPRAGTLSWFSTNF